MLNVLKMMLGIDESDTSLDAKLNWILDSSTSRLKILLGGIEPPKELQHIVVDVSIIRFNRIGSEGMNSMSVEGESNSYRDDDFAGYKDEIQAYLNVQNESVEGRLRFL
ncbi:MAG: phage head-tail connector protein [Lachnospiraceae bacterium]|nr:phage head-tail connector protein [Lachnospiraceae bacterium]